MSAPSVPSPPVEPAAAELAAHHAVWPKLPLVVLERPNLGLGRLGRPPQRRVKRRTAAVTVTAAHRAPRGVHRRVAALLSPASPPASPPAVSLSVATATATCTASSSLPHARDRRCEGRGVGVACRHRPHAEGGAAKRAADEAATDGRTRGAAGATRVCMEGGMHACMFVCVARGTSTCGGRGRSTCARPTAAAAGGAAARSRRSGRACTIEGQPRRQKKNGDCGGGVVEGAIASCGGPRRWAPTPE